MNAKRIAGELSWTLRVALIDVSKFHTTGYASNWKPKTCEKLLARGLVTECEQVGERCVRWLTPLGLEVARELQNGDR